MYIMFVCCRNMYWPVRKEDTIRIIPPVNFPLLIENYSQYKGIEKYGCEL